MSGGYTPRDHYLSVMLGAIEMIRSGVTSVVDHLWMSPAPSAEGMAAAAAAYRDIAKLELDRVKDDSRGRLREPHTNRFGALETRVSQINVEGERIVLGPDVDGQPLG